MSVSATSYNYLVIENLIDQVLNLQFPETGKAEALRLQLRQISNDHFQEHSLYVITIDRIKFKPSKNKNKSQWNENILQLLNVAYSMKRGGQKLTKIDSPMSYQTKILLLVNLITSSIILWTFNFLIKWNWLGTHPKRLSIYITWQIALFLAAYLYYKNKRANIEGILLPIILTLIPII